MFEYVKVFRWQLTRYFAGVTRVTHCLPYAGIEWGSLFAINWHWQWAKDLFLNENFSSLIFLFSLLCMYASNPGIILYKPPKDICIKFCHGLFTHKLRLLVMRKRTGQCRQTEQTTEKRTDKKCDCLCDSRLERQREGNPKTNSRRSQVFWQPVKFA